MHVVIGTTGFDLEPLREAAFAQGEPRANVLIAPNFAIGAVLMMRFAAEAAKHMAKAEIIELHHDAQARRAQRHRRAHGRADGRRQRQAARRRSTPCACPGSSPIRR